MFNFCFFRIISIWVKQDTFSGKQVSIYQDKDEKTFILGSLIHGPINENKSFNLESIKNKIEHADVFDITKEVLKQYGLYNLYKNDESL